MGAFNKFIISKKILDENLLHINMRSRTITAQLNMYRYRDKDTRQIVIYVPSLELTGYGADEEKAMEMIKFSMGDYFAFLFTLSAKKLQAELFDFKWKKNTLKNKEFSSAYIDGTGKLKNLNAVGDKVEHLSIVAA